MRIAQIMAGAEHGGAEAFFERLCIGLTGDGCAVLPMIRRDAGRAARLRGAGLDPVELGFGGGLDWATSFRLRRALRSFRPRVAVAWMGRAAAATPAGEYVLVGRLGGRYDLKRFAECDHLVANTDGLARWIVGEGWARERVHVLPNFVADFAGVAAADVAVPDGARVVLGVGRLHRNKGFDVLLAAVARLPGVYCLIAGDGPEREALERLAAAAGIGERVRFLGWREDVGALLRRADVFVCSSREEPLGNVVLEAFSAGTPVVAAMAAGPCELIRSGENGILVPCESGIALAAGIEGVIGAPGRGAAMAAAGRADFERSFAAPVVLARWRSFLETVEKPRCAA